MSSSGNNLGMFGGWQLPTMVAQHYGPSIAQQNATQALNAPVPQQQAPQSLMPPGGENPFQGLMNNPGAPQGFLNRLMQGTSTITPGQANVTLPSHAGPAQSIGGVQLQPYTSSPQSLSLPQFDPGLMTRLMGMFGGGFGG